MSITPYLGLHTSPCLECSFSFLSVKGLLWWISSYLGLENHLDVFVKLPLLWSLPGFWLNQPGMGPRSLPGHKCPKWSRCWKFRHSLKNAPCYFIQTFWKNLQNWGTYGVGFLKTILMWGLGCFVLFFFFTMGSVSWSVNKVNHRDISLLRLPCSSNELSAKQGSLLAVTSVAVIILRQHTNLSGNLVFQFSVEGRWGRNISYLPPYPLT